MAHPEHLAILRQGVEVWNEWRRNHPTSNPDLSNAVLDSCSLTSVNFNFANLTNTKLRESHLDNALLRDALFLNADLQGAVLNGSYMTGTDFSHANLRGSVLSNAQLQNAKLTKALMRGVFLSGANLTGCNLDSAELIGAQFQKAIFNKPLDPYVVETSMKAADLKYADLSNIELSKVNLEGAQLVKSYLLSTKIERCNLTRASLEGAKLRSTIILNCILNETSFKDTIIADCLFPNLDLSRAINLESTIHTRPSMIGVNTIYASKGNIPSGFLRGVGVPDGFIEYVSALTNDSIQYYSCFISYSSKNQDFADRLYADLQNSNVRCWLATEDLKIGDKFRTSIEESIRLHDKLLLVLSETSVSSPWVESEVESAMERERKENRLILFPVRLDDAVMDTNVAWAAEIRRTRHIGDFRDWKNHDSYKKALDRLLRDLKAESNP